MPLAEKKNINVCIEMLNTRDDSHPMKGHPGYQGDHTEYCIDIITQIQAVQSALGAVGQRILHKHMDHCVADALRSDSRAEAEVKIQELLTVMKRRCG